MEPLNHSDKTEGGRKPLSRQQTFFAAIAAAIVLLACGFAYQSWQISKLRAENQPSTLDVGGDSQSGTRGMSAGKTDLVNSILQINGSLDSSALEKLSEEELRQLQAAGAPGIPIGLNAAAYAAEEYAGTLEIDSITWTGEPDIDDLLPHYEIELHHPEQGDFDYEVDAFTGEILDGIKDPLRLDPLGGLTSVGANEKDIPEAVEPIDGISSVKAKKLALADAGIAEEDTDYCEVELEYEDGRLECYKVDFAAGGVEYEYEIDLYNGGILKSSQKTGYVPPTPVRDILTDEQAAAIAYSDAGVEAGGVTSLRTKLDWDDGVRIFEVEFISGGTKYEYELNAADGTIRKSEQEAASRAPAGQAVPNTPASYTYIDAAAAKDAAFQHAGIRAGDAMKVECELDEEHGLSRYEIEFTAGGTEYEYEIDAVTGVILKAEKDS